MRTAIKATDVISRGSKTSPVSILLIVLLVVSMVILFICYSPVRISLKNTVSGKAFKEAAVIAYTSMGKTFSQLSTVKNKNYYRNLSMVSFNNNCRNGMYPRTADIYRFNVPSEKVLWEEEFKEYKPVEYTAPIMDTMPVWADVDIKKHPEVKLKFNQIDGKVDRTSFVKKYEVIDGLPRNPIGRTGVSGRGLLGRWGPNHAADPIVTRWKQVSNERVKGVDGRDILQFISIQRHDTGDWALPGGMVDPGEVVTTTLQREFSEESLNIQNLSEEEKTKVNKKLKDLFSNGNVVYKGYSDDIRNTDNSWIETVAMNFHDEEGSSSGNLTLHAGDDAARAKWMDISKEMQLYANHIFFLHKTVQLHGASW